jgi:hypothetical protein
MRCAGAPRLVKDWLESHYGRGFRATPRFVKIFSETIFSDRKKTLPGQIDKCFRKIKIPDDSLRIDLQT